MGVEETPGYRLLFAISLLTSWTLGTGLIAMLGWWDEHAPRQIATWIFLWLFTVGVPTIQAFRIHAVLREMGQGRVHVSARSRRALAHARVLILICGSMTVLLVFGLLVNR
jgi:uncharacterized membrane protein